VSSLQSNPEVLEFMDAQGFEDDFLRLEGYYVEQVGGGLG
jgi:hypothetical protein